MATTLQLPSVARDGSQHSWVTELEHDSAVGTWSYNVSAPGCSEIYEARFVEVGTTDIQPEVLARHEDAFRGKGLAEALFARVVADANRTLISSTSSGDGPSQYRTIDAERVWRRLFAQERATYDSTQDRYTFVPLGGPVPSDGRTPTGGRSST